MIKQKHVLYAERLNYLVQMLAYDEVIVPVASCGNGLGHSMSMPRKVESILALKITAGRQLEEIDGSKDYVASQRTPPM